MVRPFRVKLRKLKKRKLEEEEEEPAPVNAEEEKIRPVNCGGEAEEGGSDDEKKAGAAVNEMPGIPISQPLEGSKKPGVIFVLERASLEFAKVGKTFQILNSDDHANYLKRQNRNPADYRPDIVHQDYFPSQSMNQKVRVVREKLDQIQSSSSNVEAGSASKKARGDNRRRI